jgi:dTDP-glucose 4,6-dehydratase
MRHVITGGLGFTGRYLTEELVRRGDEIVVFDQERWDAAQPQGVRFVRGDITDPAALKGIGFKPGDVVHHLAARQFHGNVPHRARDPWFNAVNVEGTKHLLEAMHEGGATELVFFSTDMVYGLPDCSPIPPSHPRRPLGPYGRSKCAAEDLIAAGALRGLRATVFRPRLIVGAGRLGVLAKLFRLIEAGRPVPLIGDGRNRYQMVSVHDCVAAALRAVDAGLPAGPFNLGSQDPPTVRDLLQGLIDTVGSRSRLLPTPAGAVKLTLSLLDRVGLTLLHAEQYMIADRDCVLDVSETQARLAFTPLRGDREMLLAAYEEYRSGRAAASARTKPGLMEYR